MIHEVPSLNQRDHSGYLKPFWKENHYQLSNYNSFEGVLYSRPHFDQLFKRTGSLDKSFEGTPKIAKPEKTGDEKPAATKVSTMFGGTRDKCAGCQKTVYPTEKCRSSNVSEAKTRDLFISACKMWSPEKMRLRFLNVAVKIALEYITQ
ncbi:hypothetical protein VNO78_11875 [Psophocarpus tetragonolobus]|uniref:Uncharacterized protein n=1 Tax=Psophocarpus tetragonolobus TaxID=3891 RepID=A0AAN9XP39_PSOTE